MRRGPLALNIAWRYLIAPKTHGAVSAISIISVVGVAVATAAIVIVLSVFNGFKYHLNARLDSLTPDVSVMSLYGKTIENGDSLAREISKLPGVSLVMPEVADNALVIAGSKEMPVKLKGVTNEVFSQLTRIDSLLMDGSPVRENTPKEVSVAVGVAQRLGMYSAGDDLFLFAPKRHGRVNLANPMSSFLTDSVRVTSIFRSMQNEIDENTVIADIETARELFQYDTEATSLLVQAEPGVDPGQLAIELTSFLGEDFVVKDRLQQQEVNFRMVSIEKWITFILLTFILIIASFNIISTLCMIVLDKGQALNTLWHIGLSKKRIGTVFWWESILVTLTGAGIGLVIGVVISLIQEKFSIIKLAGDSESLVIHAYPVRVEWFDLGVTLVPVIIIGLITAWISEAFAKGRLKRSL